MTKVTISDELFSEFFNFIYDHLGIIWGPSGDHLGVIRDHPPPALNYSCLPPGDRLARPPIIRAPSGP